MDNGIDTTPMLSISKNFNAVDKTAKAIDMNIWVRITAIPLRNTESAIPADSIGFHMAKAKSKPKEACKSVPTHNLRIAGPSTTNPDADAAAKLNASTIDRKRVFRIQPKSPRANASPYAGHRGDNIIPTTMATMLKRRSGTP